MPILLVQKTGLTRGEGLRIAGNIAKLPELLQRTA
jgi:hypothetical protein